MKSSHRMEVIRAILSNKIATNYDKLQIKGKGDGALIQNVVQQKVDVMQEDEMQEDVMQVDVMQEK